MNLYEKQGYEYHTQKTTEEISNNIVIVKCSTTLAVVFLLKYPNSKGNYNRRYNGIIAEFAERAYKIDTLNKDETDKEMNIFVLTYGSKYDFKTFAHNDGFNVLVIIKRYKLAHPHILSSHVHLRSEQILNV